MTLLQLQFNTQSPPSYPEAFSNKMNDFIPPPTLHCDVIAWNRTKPPCWALKTDSVKLLNSRKQVPRMSLELRQADCFTEICLLPSRLINLDIEFIY